MLPPPTPTLTSITVTPANPSLPLNRTRQLIATGNYSNGSTQNLTGSVTWSGGNADVALSATGMVSAASAAVGNSATITATDPTTLLAGSTTVTLAADATTYSLNSANGNFISDPLGDDQWHLRNTGQNAFADGTGVAGEDVNAETAYNNFGYDGSGVVVAVVDTGLEMAHEDLTANVLPGWDFLNSDTDPTYTGTDGDHGTAVAGLIGADRNALGGLGVASGASLKGFNFLNPLYSPTVGDLVDSLGGSTSNPDSTDVWVFNQSFGIATSGPETSFTAIVNQYSSGTSTLRDGKGALYIKAAGNGFEDNYGVSSCAGANGLGISCENANYDPDNTLPFNIVVGAINADGVRSSYSTTGSALWVSAPGGEYGANASVIGGGFPVEVYEPAMISTDQSSCASGWATTTDGISTFDRGVAPNGDTQNASCNYLNSMNGTSSATPVTAGVVALILEANPELTWRDVKHILASTSEQIEPLKSPIIAVLSDGAYTVEPAWTTNGVSFAYHNWYGFGRVDVTAAVNMARSYTYGQLGTFTNTNWITSGALSLAIPNNSINGPTHTIAVPDNLVIEAVQIRVSATHSYTGDLGIELTSPAGTRSVLKYIRDGFDSNNLADYQMLSNVFYGESSNGNWTVKVVDGAAGNSGGLLTAWQIRIYGHTP